MIFTVSVWRRFCRALCAAGFTSVPLRDVTGGGAYLSLKHDVETRVRRAWRLAKVEHALGHRGSYYVQADLLSDPRNVAMLREMRDWGHEISYHHDVMDACGGDLAAARELFSANKQLFEEAGFPVATVCQHGNPMAAREGYTSNRDFFRDPAVRAAYPAVCDIMVDFPEAHRTSYRYFSDAGRRFHLVADPLENDRRKSEKPDVTYRTARQLLAALSTSEGNIVSIHPHRYTLTALGYCLSAALFYTARAAAKLLAHIPFFRKKMQKHYRLAKKL